MPRLFVVYALRQLTRLPVLFICETASYDCSAIAEIPLPNAVNVKREIDPLVREVRVGAPFPIDVAIATDAQLCRDRSIHAACRYWPVVEQPGGPCTDSAELF